MAKHLRDHRPLTYSSEAGINYADDDLLPQEPDLVFEAELLRNPKLPSLWSRYLDARKDAPAKRRYIIFERAVNALPGSYKVCSSDRTFHAIYTVIYVAGRGATAYFCRQLRVSDPTQFTFFLPRQPSTDPLSHGSFFVNNSYGMHTLKNVIRLHAFCALLMLRTWLSITRLSVHWSRCTRCRRSGSSTLTFLLNNKM